MVYRIWAVAALALTAAEATAAEGDSLRHWGYGVTLHPNWQLALDEWVRQWLYDTDAFAVSIEATHSALPQDSSAIDADFGYPTVAVGLRYGDNHRVTMQKPRTTDYFSHLGNTLTLYGAFQRPFFRTRHWEADYTLATGVGYNSLKYNKTDDIDNELIGSSFLIYFNAGLHVAYHPVPQWGIKAGLEFCHHSNGALARPNKGANSLGPSLSLVYTPYYEATVRRRATTPGGHRRSAADDDALHRSYLDFSVGVGGKTLLEDWHRTQSLPKSDPDYCTEDFTFYMAYSMHAKWMYRYARRWASGVGADLFYGSYADHVRELDERAKRTDAHSPWSVGLSANHSVFYRNFSLQVALGYYLYREMGYSAKQIEKPYYERVGLFYTLPKVGNLTLGISLNAHMTKADFTEFVVSYPIKL
jgi:hypothetical protein